MSDGRKRLSGAEYKKQAKKRQQEQERVILQTKKIDSIFSRGSNKSPGEHLAVYASGSGSNTSAIIQEQLINRDHEDKDIEIEETESGVNPNPPLEKPEDFMQVKHDDFKLNNDPALWKIDEVTRDLIAMKGFNQNKSSDLSKSGRQYSEQRRFLPMAIFRRKMKNNELRDRTWLIFSESKGSVYCGPCLAFSSSTTQFDSQNGFNDWKNAEARVAAHESSEGHNASVLALANRSALQGRIDEALVLQLNEEKSYWRNVLKRVVAVVKRLASRGLAFRGKNEVIGDQHNGNYLMTLEIIAEFDPFLAQHIERYGNKGSGTSSYLSKNTCDVFINLMAEKVMKQIVDELKAAKYFSLIVDSTPDIAHVDQLTIVVRYVLETGEPCERFLKFLPSVGHKSEDMYSAIISELESLSINIEDCRGQAYDNASNMSGAYNGLQAKIKEVAPLADYIPCAAHSLNLVVSSTAESCTAACHFFILLQEVYVFFANSTNRWEKLQAEMGKRKKTLKRVNITRWSARDDACRSLRDSWHEVLRTLKAIEQDPTEKPIAVCEASGILRKLHKVETAFMVVFWSAILEKINKTSAHIQSSTVDLVTVEGYYGSLHHFFDALRNDFQLFELEARNLSVTKEYEVERSDKRVHKRKKFYDESSEEEEDCFSSASDSFRIDIFYVIIDRVLLELKKRKDAYSGFCRKFAFLAKINEYEENELRDQARYLMKMYPNDLEDEFCEECLHFKTFISSANIKKPELKSKSKTLDLETFSTFIRKNGLQNVFPNLDIALRMALCTPATNCSGERSFSCLKNVKNYHRSTLSQEKLNSLALLCIESPLVQSMTYDDIIDDFASVKSHKKKF